MSDGRGNESTFEEATIQRLRILGYKYAYGPELACDLSQKTATLETLQDTLPPGLLSLKIAPKAAEKTVAEVV